MLNSKLFLIATIILVCALVLEQIISKTVSLDFYRNQLSWIFISIAVISLVLQYFIIHYIVSISKQERSKLAYILLILTQSIITVLMISLLAQIISGFNRPYENSLLVSIVSISYALAIFIIARLAYRFLKLYKIRTNATILLYGLVFVTLTINAILNLMSINLNLGNFLFLPFSIPDSCLHWEIPPSCSSIEIPLHATWFASLLLLWASSIFLISSYRNILGKTYWFLVISPVTLIVYFLLPLYLPFLIPLLLSNVDVGVLVLSILLYFTSQFIPAYAFGTSFRTLTKIITDNHIRRIIIIAGLGLFLYLLAFNQSPIISNYPYSHPKIPPYGIITLSLAGLFTNMINIIRIEDLPINKKIPKNT